jgi:glycosyltransferase involved in cell wall biosynthesis
MLDPRNPDFQNTPVSNQRPNFHYKPEDRHSMPAVSIITPFYNTGAIFEETAQSVLQQSLQQWEWIIVNDGSTDPESLAILDKYRGLNERIRVVDHLHNKGLPAARNTGARTARTEYLLYLDSDDLLEPTAAEKWLWFLESYPQYSFVGSYLVGFEANPYLWQSGFQDREANLKRNQINQTSLIRKAVVEAVGGYDESMRQGLEDWDFWVRCAAQGYWGDSLPEYLHWYRWRSGHTERWDSLKEERLDEKSDEFRRRYPHLWQGKFPVISTAVDINIVSLPEEPPCLNRLHKVKPRLLIVAPWLVSGGAEKFNLDLMRQLSQRGWELTIATTIGSHNPWQHEFEAITPDVFPMKNFLEWKDYPRFLAYLIQSRQVDAVLVTGSQETYRLLPYLRIRFPQIPILDYIHFIIPEWMEGGFARLSLLFHSCLDLSVVTSQHLKNWMVAEGADPERVDVCTANVDIHSWHPDSLQRAEVRSQLGVSDEQTLILYIGRLEQQKQPHVFAKTMQRLGRQELPFLAVVAGDGSLRNWVQDFIEKEHLMEKVRLLGDVSQQKVRELMQAGDILFLPSENEGIALTIYEAMASGIVPVGAKVGGQAELVTPECGILVSRNTEDQEAEHYARVLADLICQPEKRRQMGRNSRARVEDSFNLDKMGERMESLIYKATQLRQQEPRTPAPEQLGSFMARQTAEYLRAVGELKRIEPYLKDYMPPASASTYFYFAFRQLVYPILGPLRQKKWFLGIKSKIKAYLVGKANKNTE